MSAEDRIHEPDDYLSEMIFDKFGDQYDYLGKDELRNGAVAYRYNVEYSETNDLAGLISYINQNISDNDDKIKFCFILYGSNYSECPFSLSNYSSDDLETADYNGLYVLRVNHDKMISYGTVWADPSTYTIIPDIKVLDVDMGMQEEARNLGIGWRDIWPDMEKINVTDYAIEDIYFRTVHGMNCYTFDISHGGENIYIKQSVGRDVAYIEEILADDNGNKTVLWNDQIICKNNTSEMYFLYKDGNEYDFLKYEYIIDGNAYRISYKVFYLDTSGEQIIIDQDGIFGLVDNPSDVAKAAEFEEKLNSYLDYSSFFIGTENGKLECAGILGYYLNN